ncbi:thioredoxin domain-containing protein, partial [Candidatus Falkowbacteria bacterium]|nr:thioredoxin domain-containing protein [Candidatus Falkowbacteria bacterium]
MQQTNNIQSPKKWYLRWWAIIIWAVLALVLVFFIAMSFYVISKSKAGNNAPNVKKSQPYDKKSYEGSTNFSQGPKNAEINIVEFGDFACSHTKNSFYTMKKILSTHKNIRLVFRDYPNVAEQSLDLAIAARCAGEQKLFWQMH